MDLTAPLDGVFAGGSHVRVLRTLHELPEGVPASVREVARRARVSHPAASRALSSLADDGVVDVHRYGRADMYEVNRRHVFFAALGALFAREARVKADLEAFLGERISRLKGVRQAYLFGSAARDEMRRGSDIDVALFAPGQRTEDLEPAVSELSDSLRRRFGWRVSFIVATAALPEMTKARRPGRELWARILREGRPLLPSAG